MTKALFWKTKGKIVKVTDLKELLNKLIDIKQEEVNKEISLNLKGTKLLKWLETNFPQELELIANLKQSLKEFTPQQIRESLVRDLRKAI
jgi:hypothetical protein